MAKSEAYRVDLSSLEQVVKDLNGILKQLNGADSSAKYKTTLSPTALGTGANGVNFTEADKMTKAHAVMKRHIEEIVEHLNEVMDQYGKKTKRAHGAYQDQDADVVRTMNG
ncbi:hypothetical protein [Streptomyces alkaliterrae]|uniref:PE domain-containing protein n=1 Tax=Streptomyces alkaliterrae TaxID=2213162 RepID=A0A5P0YTY6_9ACTN|nr:hypothetical protein [Streptomyces alkaliterrae]MBB1258477.1 hypothetical protein [Streptomyces alkaliterrae]MQS03776.1 hypothetical protein [Streptomyces alkaliterrae]